MSVGISNLSVADTPIAVIDFETTGLTAGYDRVVEVSVVRIDPGEQPRVVFDTLVNPCRRMSATEIHGITEADVERAPRFQDIAGEVVEAIKGCVVAAYNIYFDIKFLSFELSNVGLDHEPPHLCLMYLRPMLGLGPRCKLEVACRSHGFNHEPKHLAAHDALAAGHLCRTYLAEMRRRDIVTFGHLANLKRYKFNDSFSQSPFVDATNYGLKRCQQICSRAGHAPPTDPIRQAMGAYWDSLKTVLADLEITDEELHEVLAERSRGGLKEEQIRVLHARAFVSVISQFTSDQWLDDREAKKLRRLHSCLAQLGWAPGL
jgi:DNA polymerase-3 subunit epsilon